MEKIILLSAALVLSSLAEEQFFLRMGGDMHTAVLYRIDVDAQGRFMLTCGIDKVAYLRDAKTGEHLQTYRPPLGEGHEGKLMSCAISPDGSQVAVGGYTRLGSESGHTVYVFDRATGRMTGSVGGMGNVINDLEYSPDGRTLLACCGSTAGVWMLDPARKKSVQHLGGYQGTSYNAAFAPDGRFATVSNDGYVRLYDATGKLLKKEPSGGGKSPISLAFLEDGSLLAVGCSDSARLQVLDGHSLELMFEPDNAGADSLNQNLSSVCFSDGQLFSAGVFHKKVDGKMWMLLRCWPQNGRGEPQDAPVCRNSVMDIKPHPAGGVLFGGSQPDCGWLKDGERKWRKAGAVANLRSNDRSHFRLSPDGLEVGFKPTGAEPLSFSLTARTLEPRQSVAPCYRDDAGSIRLTDWDSTFEPKLNGRKLNWLSWPERCRSVATDGRCIVLGATWNLYGLDADGSKVWKTPTPDVSAVNMAPVAGVCAAALGDGTIRWYRLSDGEELLALYVHPEDHRWLLYTPQGYYDASPGAASLAGWHVNNGSSQAADFFPLSRFSEQYYRPDVIARIMDFADVEQALAAANRDSRVKAAAKSVLASLPPVVSLLAPSDGCSVRSHTVALRYSTRTPGDAPQPVTEVRALVNGRPAAQTRGMQAVAKGNAIEVELPPGESLVGIQARNANGWSEPATVRITCEAAQDEFVIKPKLYVLAVGVSDYAKPELKLKYPAKDAREVTELLSSQKGGLYRDVVTRVLTDADTSRESILEGLDWIEHETTQQDVALIFMAGHAVNDNRGELYYLPCEADPDSLRSSALRVEEVSFTIEGIVGKVLCFLDTCHSGNIRVASRRAADSFDLTGTIMELASAEKGAVVFCSSSGRQFSLEDDAWGNGAFTKAILTGLGGRADMTGDGKITINELDLYLSEEVKKLTGGRQTPVTTKPETIRDYPIVVHHRLSQRK